MNIAPDSLYRPLRDILKTVVVPVFSIVLFFVWMYALVQLRTPNHVVFPTITVLVVYLYLFSGYVHAGVLLAFASAVAVLALFVPPYGSADVIMLMEAVGVWLLFFNIDRYRVSSQTQRNTLAEKLESIDVRISLQENKVAETRRVCDELNQRIFNFQMLGRMIEVFGLTLREDKVIPLVSEMASKMIRQGVWKVKKGVQNDIFAEYVKTQGLPLIIANIKNDARFIVKKPRFSSLIALPLEVDGHYWGIIKGTAHQATAFSEADLRTLSLLGGITSLVLSNCKLYQMTQDLGIMDGLTGLYLHGYFRERLRGEMNRSRGKGLSLIVAILDVDHFKAFNDAHGHAGGDVILRHIAMLLRRRLRETDFLSRYGGEEFAVIMVQTELPEAGKIIEEVRRSVEEERIFLPLDGFKPVSVRATISAGIAALSPMIATDEDLIRAADTALYRAKTKGRNRVEIYE